MIRFSKFFIFAIPFTLLIACSMEENPLKAVNDVDWNAHQPIDDREFIFEDNTDSRKMSLTKSDVAQIQRELQVEIPPFVKRWMISNPVKKFDEDPEISFVFRDYLIEENVRLRRDGYYGRAWPADLLWIDKDPGGGAYFVQSGDDREIIYWFDWETAESEAVSIEKSVRETPDEFLKTLVEFYDNPDS